MAEAPHAFFHAAGAGRPGQRLYLLHTPPAAMPSRGAVLYVQAFAEEMNKSRRMAALQARALAAAGYVVLQPDLLGCGDSSGDFGDATWDDWVADVVEAAAWLRERHPGTTWLWGLRAGTLLACAAASRLPMRCDFLFWQPATSGRLVLQQFLRLKAAGEMLGGGAKGLVEGLRQQLAAGQAVEVAGYRLHPALAAGLEAAKLSPPTTAGARVEWFEVQAPGGSALTPAAERSAQAWAQAGAALRTHVVEGPAFWQTTEIEEAPDLLAATLAAVQETAATSVAVPSPGARVPSDSVAP